MRLKKILMTIVPLMFLAVVFACGNDDESRDEITSPLASAPTELMEIESLPSWLCDVIQEREASCAFGRVYRGVYNDKTVYAVEDTFSSTAFKYDFFRADGTTIQTGNEIFKNSRGWKCIYSIAIQ